MLDLYTWNTYNGRKGRIAVEESGLPYNLHPVNLPARQNVGSEYAALSGSRRIPTVVDSDGPGGAPITLIESGVIMVYLAKKTGNGMYPTDPREQLEVDQWAMHGQSTFGPGLTPIRHLELTLVDNNESAKEFYRPRTDRLFQVLDDRLAGHDYICLDTYTVADVAHFTAVHGNLPITDLDRFPNVKRWYETILARPAVQRGLEPVG